MKKFIIIGIITFFILIIFIFLFLLFSEIGLKNKYFIIEEGKSIPTISNNLKKEGIIKNDFLFLLFIKAFNKDLKVVAGEYLFSGYYNIPNIIKILSAGPSNNIKKTYDITIIEGWDKYKVAEYFDNLGKFSYKKVLDFIDEDWKSDDNLMKFEFLDKNLESLEGFIFPDTYQIYENSSLNEIFYKILLNFNTKIFSEFSKYNNFYDKLIMASIIEKEAMLDSDRGFIASVIYNRINSSMPLQMDSTIIYVTRDRNNIANDKFLDFEYNTYKYTGLTPTPISNPGYNSIYSAFNPEISDYYYFINKQDTGEAIFAKTLNEHNYNINKYLR
ncbi:endolytic transglycosylase MltG [Patescibacteria group bacterium]|nr:endolytic transglycosylase MltG [Patescibacteria group bacterium]